MTSTPLLFGGQGQGTVGGSRFTVAMNGGVVRLQTAADGPIFLFYSCFFCARANSMVRILSISSWGSPRAGQQGPIQFRGKDAGISMGSGETKGQRG
jgi:hypothetical protein